MFRFNLYIFFAAFILSCNNEPKGRIETKAKPLDWKVRYKKSQWEEVNDKLFKKYKTKIELTDIDAALKILVKQKLIEKNFKVNNTIIPEFTYYSPTVELDNLLTNRDLGWPKEMRVLSYDDKDFILAQQKLRHVDEFKWKWITNHTDTLGSYPQYHISIPVFSCDKRKLIVCIEKYTSENCMKGNTYLFVIKANDTKHFAYEEVQDCE